MPRYNIKVRLAMANKKQVDLLREIKERGIPYPYTSLQSTELSSFISGTDDPPKSDAILEMCDQILTEWEASNGTH